MNARQIILWLEFARCECDDPDDMEQIDELIAEVRADKEKIVLDVAGEIFGAIKRHGLVNAEDPETLDAWVHEMGLHHHLFQAAHPESKDKEGMDYARGLDEFDAELSGVINPQDHWTCDHCGRFFEGLDQPPRNQCPADDCPSKDEPPGDTFKTSDGFVLTRKPRFWGNEFYWTDGDLSFRDVAGWPVDEDGGERLVQFKEDGK